MAQWNYRAGSFVSAGNAAGDALVVTKPTGASPGEVIEYVVYWETDTNTVTPPSGFVSIFRQTNAGAFMLEIFKKLAGTGEPASYTFTPATNGQWRSIVGAAYSGGTAVMPWNDGIDGAQGDAVAEASQIAPSVISGGAKRELVFGYGNLSGTNPTSTSGAANNLRGSLGGTALADANRGAGSTGTTQAVGASTQTYAAIHDLFTSETPAGPPFNLRRRESRPHAFSPCRAR